ncbi:MAG: NAD(P)H-dependent oxidoreductase [Chloroflexi bacterium]|nr:NAD(P)H-dependent oxidoreductase [Chloroflexota bacterium]
MRIDSVADSQITILGIAGSLRRASFNRGLLIAAQELAPEGVAVEIFDLAPIPFYNGDVEAEGTPDAVLQLRARIEAADALLLTVPEYNHSFPAVLKNALDWASRPRPVSALRQKPVALAGAGGGFGTVRAQLALRPVLASNEAYLMPKPELYIQQAPRKFDADGRLTDEATRASLAGLVAALADWAQKVRSA